MLKTWCTFTLITSFSKNDLVPTPLHGVKRICCIKIKYDRCWLHDSNGGNTSDVRPT
jgi:hypothetical protein